MVVLDAAVINSSGVVVFFPVSCLGQRGRWKLYCLIPPLLGEARIASECSLSVERSGGLRSGSICGYIQRWAMSCVLVLYFASHVDDNSL